MARLTTTLAHPDRWPQLLPLVVTFRVKRQATRQLTWPKVSIRIDRFLMCEEAGNCYHPGSVPLYAPVNDTIFTSLYRFCLFLCRFRIRCFDFQMVSVLHFLYMFCHSWFIHITQDRHFCFSLVPKVYIFSFLDIKIRSRFTTNWILLVILSNKPEKNKSISIQSTGSLSEHLFIAHQELYNDLNTLSLFIHCFSFEGWGLKWFIQFYISHFKRFETFIKKNILFTTESDVFDRLLLLFGFCQHIQTDSRYFTCISIYYTLSSLLLLKTAKNLHCLLN